MTTPTAENIAGSVLSHLEVFRAGVDAARRTHKAAISSEHVNDRLVANARYALARWEAQLDAIESVLTAAEADANGEGW